MTKTQFTPENKTILIHGFGQAAHFFPFRNIKMDEEIFPVFTKEIQQKNAVVFNWAHNWPMNFNSFLGAKSFQKLYFIEREIAKSRATLQKLEKLIEANNPSVIVAHSMGCFLLLEYFKNHKPNKNLKKICFIQADISNESDIPKNLKTAVQQQKLAIINAYCYWDQALLYSSILHKKPRAGLTGWKHENVENRFVALLDFPNPHEDILRNKKVKKLIDGKLPHRGGF